LCESVKEMENGLIDAKLSNYLVKKRIPIPSKGKSGGARTLLATNYQDRWFFILGFEKSKKENINPKELSALQMLASDLVELSLEKLELAKKEKALLEICNEKDN
jgi:hypothetical protein